MSTRTAEAERPDGATPLTRVLASEWTAIAVLLAATMAACWPMSGFRTVASNPDTSFTVLAMERIQDALLQGGDWRSIGLAWPLPDSITQVDWIFAEAVLGLPLRAIGLDPLLAHSVSALVGLFGTAWACHRAAVLLLGRGPHTWLAGIAGGLNPVQLHHVQHVNLVHHEVMVVAALLLGAGLAGGRPRWTAIGGFLAITGVHFGAYLGVHGGLVAAIVAIVAAAARVGSARAWLAAAGGALVGGLTLVPVVSTYLRVAERFEVWFDRDALTLESWDLAQTFSPLDGAPLHRWLAGDDLVHLLDPPNPGYLAAALAVVGVATLRPAPHLRWAWIAVAVTGIGTALLALGPDILWNTQRTGLPGPYRLLAALPGLDGIRSPARWLAVAFIALSLPAAAGARHVIAWAIARAGRWAGLAVAIGVGAVALLEVPGPQARARMADVQLEPVYRLLDALPPGGVLYDDALVRRDLPPSCDARIPLRAALFHGRPLVGGFFARKFQVLEKLTSIATSWPSAEARELFAAVGVVAVVEHQNADPSDPDGWSCTWAGTHRLCRSAAPARPPLLTTASVGTEPNGPVIGIRYAEANAVAEQISVACGQRRRRIPTSPWRALSSLRGGLGRDAPVPLDVFLDEPCTRRIGADPPGAIPLYAARGVAPEVLASLPTRSGRTVAESFHSLRGGASPDHAGADGERPPP